MDFGLSEQQRDVRELAASILGEQVTAEKLARYDHYQQPRFDRELWAQLAEAGLLGVAVDEQYGGMGFGFFEAALLVEEAGRTIAPLPVISHMVSAMLPLSKFGSPGLKQTWLPQAVRGEVLLSAALTEPGNENPLTPTRCKASIDGENLLLRGEKHGVPFAQQSDRILLAADCEGENVVVLLDPRASGVSLHAIQVTHYEPQYRLVLDAVLIPPTDIVARGADAIELLRYSSELTTVATCAHQLGAADKAMRMTASYTAERKQFGVPIATFQAVGHRAANCFIDVECLRLNCYQAISLLDAGKGASLEVAIAKIWAGDVGHRVSYAAQHLHGGTGIDRDYPLWRYCTWLRHNELFLGGSARHLAALGEKIAAGEGFCA